MAYEMISVAQRFFPYPALPIKKNITPIISDKLHSKY